MGHGNNGGGGSIFKPEDWIGYAYLALLLAIAINMFTILVFGTDWMAAIGVVIVSEHKMLVFAFFAVLFFVNLKHDDSDRIWNFFAIMSLLVVLAVGNIGVKIDVSQAGQKMSQAAANAQQRAASTAQEYRPPVPQQQTVSAAPAPVQQVPQNAWYNIYLKNKQSGSNYSYCVQLLQGGDIARYRQQKCNTGAPISKNNIATCQKWQRNNGLNKYRSEGCGFTKHAQYRNWCNLNVGQKGQNRDLFCR